MAEPEEPTDELTPEQRWQVEMEDEVTKLNRLSQESEALQGEIDERRLKLQKINEQMLIQQGRISMLADQRQALEEAKWDGAPPDA
jgi:hypothetical protein